MKKLLYIYIYTYITRIDVHMYAHNICSRASPPSIQPRKLAHQEQRCPNTSASSRSWAERSAQMTTPAKTSETMPQSKLNTVLGIGGSIKLRGNNTRQPTVVLECFPQPQLHGRYRRGGRRNVCRCLRVLK